MITQYLTKNPCYQAGRTIDVKGLMLHSVGVNQPDPMVFIKQWDSPDYSRACVHGFLGEKETYITLPVLETPGKAMRGWHGGGASNNTHLGFEMCEPAEIKYTGGASFTVTDRDAAVQFAQATLRQAVALFAQLCKFHGLDPTAPGVVISHKEGHALGIATDHSDPEHLWQGLSMDYTMDRFRSEVAAAMAGTEEEEEMDIPKLIEELTNEQAYTLYRKAQNYAATLQEADWSKKEGFWEKAAQSGIINSGNPECAMSRDEVISVLGRLGLLK